MIKFIGAEAEVVHVDRVTSIQDKTGYEGDKDVLKNIYDLEGNNWEWTAQANNTGSRVNRGGNYNNVSYSYYYPASNRYNNGPNSTFSFFTSRPTLYVAL